MPILNPCRSLKDLQCNAQGTLREPMANLLRLLYQQDTSGLQHQVDLAAWRGGGGKLGARGAQAWSLGLPAAF